MACLPEHLMIVVYALAALVVAEAVAIGVLWRLLVATARQ